MTKAIFINLVFILKLFFVFMVQHFLKITNKDKYFGAVPKITLHAKCKISPSLKKNGSSDHIRQPVQ